MSKELYFEGAGVPGTGGEVGNCRIRTALHADDGKAYYLEIAGNDYSKEQRRYMDPDGQLKDYKFIGYVMSCHEITNDPKLDDENNSRHSIDNGTFHFPWTQEGILQVVNEQLGCSYDKAEIAPVFSGYQVFTERPEGYRTPDNYNFGDEFKVDPISTKLLEDLYKQEKQKQADLGVDFPAVSVYRDSHDPELIHVAHYGKAGLKNFDTTLSELAKTAQVDRSFTPYVELSQEQKARVNNADEWVREKAAKEGLGLDRLVDDPSDVVRTRVAFQGYGLDKLVDAPESIVRAAVAGQGYGLNKLVADPNDNVRFLVARQGYGLDKLVDDPDVLVRRKVAEHGFGLDKLITDEDYSVQKTVQDYLKNNNQTLEQWVEANPDKCVLPENKAVKQEKTVKQSGTQAVKGKQKNTIAGWAKEAKEHTSGSKKQVEQQKQSGPKR